MIKKTFVVTGLLAQFILVPTAFSMSCDNPINAYDKTYCASLQMIQLDQEINEQYGKTLKVLTPDQKKQVKHTQIQWIRSRDKDCSNNGLVSVSCANDKMKARISVLKSIERECKQSGCDDSSLTRVD